MTTTALPTDRTRQDGVELLVSRVALGMLRWSQHRSNRRRLTHEQMVRVRQAQRDAANAVDLSRLF